jgi:hypothetical protein
MKFVNDEKTEHYKHYEAPFVLRAPKKETFLNLY